MRKGIIKLVVMGAITALIVIIYNAVAIWQFSKQDQTRHADCAIVAGAGIKGEGPGAVFKARLDHAIWLYHEGFVRTLILTGGMSPGATRSDAAVAKAYVLANAVPDADILIEERSTVTRENLRYAAELMHRHQLKTALLVSDPLHMLRMRIIAWDNHIESWSSPTTASRYQSGSTRFPFLLREAFYYTGYRILRYLPVIPVQKISTDDHSRL
ncbi:YdcF family protein [Yokenella regensburgei]|uniref:YdcF family protein n=1 Tax=Yokenella regensburgei TaxID=158877 RepID=UPI003F138D5A